MPKTVLYVNKANAGPLKDGEARHAVLFGAEMPDRVGLVLLADRERLVEKMIALLDAAEEHVTGANDPDPGQHRLQAAMAACKEEMEDG